MKMSSRERLLLACAAGYVVCGAGLAGDRRAQLGAGSGAVRHKSKVVLLLQYKNPTLPMSCL